MNNFATTSGSNDGEKLSFPAKQSNELTSAGMPSLCSLEVHREALSRVLNLSSRLYSTYSVNTAASSEERELLQIFEGQSGKKSVDFRKEIVRNFLINPEYEEIRDKFLKEMATIVLRRANTNHFDELGGSEETLRAVLQHHSEGNALIQQIFNESLIPENRNGISRLVGKISIPLQKELFASVFGNLVYSPGAFSNQLRDPDGLASVALRFHDSVRLLRRVELLFDREAKSYESALEPFRNSMRESLNQLVIRDFGDTLGKVLERCLGSPLSLEEKHTLFPAIFGMQGSQRLKADFFVSFIAVPSIKSWLASDAFCSELMPKPVTVCQLFRGDIVKSALSSTIEHGYISPYASAVIKLMRYLSRSGWLTAPSLLNQKALDDLASQALAAGELGVKFICEVIDALSLVSDGCIVGMRSVLRLLEEEEKLTKHSSSWLLSEVKTGLERHPEVIEKLVVEDEFGRLNQLVDRAMMVVEGVSRG